MLRNLVLALAFVTVPAGMAQADEPCRPVSFAAAPYTICSFDLRQDKLELYNLDSQGQPYGTFSALSAALEAQGRTLAFAMNAGMFDQSLKPIGLYIERGRQLKRINRRSGGGNFHMKPNGVFYIGGDSGGVMESEAFVKAALHVDYATQSGPMLVIDGAIHPKFSAGGTSAKLRNGVGSLDGHHVIFAISDQPVTFYDFARFFRDGLHCRNALFLDGNVSSLYAPGIGRDDGYLPLGPMVGLAK
jgi:uncharacterized protein YigE (DUF2233 family)